jgi:hypothetical protein
VLYFHLVSDVSDAATVRLFLADYAIADPTGKVNAIGAGLTAVAINPASGLTAGFALFVQIGVPPEFYGVECAVEIALEDAGGQLVELPSQAPGLPAQPLRVGQAVRLNEPQFLQPVNAPTRYLPARIQWVLGFATGLPLAVAQGYRWRVRIDGETRDDWIERFVVLGPAAGPVIG